jgi:hypothetical protein
MMPHTVAAPEIPLYQLGNLDRADRRALIRRHKLGATVHAPAVPLYQRGHLGAAAQIVGASAPIAAAATTAAITGGSAAAAGTTAGAVAGPIGMAVGAVVGIIAGLLAGHELRAKQARNENSAVNIGVSGFDSDLKQIWQAFKSGQIDASGVLQAIPTVMQGYWTVVAPQLQPGRNGCTNGTSCPIETPGKQPCVGSIGAGCCIACYQLSPALSAVELAVQGQSPSAKGPYVAEIPQVYGSSYGASSRAGYTLDFSPPATASSSVSSALSSLTGGSGSGLLPLLLIAGAVWMVSR